MWRRATTAEQDVEESDTDFMQDVEESDTEFYEEYGADEA
jgi:hypothetical protein